MSSDFASTAISPTTVKGCLVVPLPADLAGELEPLRELVLDGVRNQRAHTVVLDFAALQLIDSTEFATVREILHMAALLGARSVMAGLRPGVVAYLVWNDVDTQGLTFMRDLDEALSMVFLQSDQGLLQGEPDVEANTTDTSFCP